MSVFLGLTCIAVSLWKNFAQPEYRGVRLVFLGLSCIVMSLWENLLSQNIEE